MLKDNIKVGDYARNKKGIGKITDIKDHGEYVEIILDNFHDIIEYPNGKEAETLRNKIVMRKGTMREDIKIGKLIDLIEVGDYVNGDRVKALKGDIESHKINNEEDVIYTEYINDYDEWCGYEEDEIKSIVTKECFKKMEYKIER